MTAPRERSISVHGVVEADFDGDGKLDLAGPAGSPSGGVAVLLADGRGGFGAPITYLAGRFGPAVVAADLDGDQDVDLVATWWDRSGSRMATLILNNGDGTFAHPSDLDVTEEPDAASGDVNGDGAIDLVFVTPTRQVTVLLNDGHGAFTATDYAAGPWPAYPSAVAVADLDDNGTADVAVTMQGEPTAKVMLASRDGRLAQPVSYALGDDRDFHATAVAAADIDGDGRIDLVVSTSETTLTVSGGVVDGRSYVNVLRNAGDGAFVLAGSHASGASGRLGAAGDLNGDGLPDLVIVDDYLSRDVKVMLNDGQGAFPPAAAGYAAGAAPVQVAIGDLDGDGRPDLVVASEGFTFLRNGGGGAFAAAPMIAGGRHVALGDLDGDGRTDVFTADTGGGTALLFGRAGGEFAPAMTDDAGGAAEVVLADVDRDGRPDAIVIDYIAPSLQGGDVLIGGRNGGYSVRINDGHGRFVRKSVHDGGSGIQAIAVADLDGDGSPDLALAGGDSTGSSHPWLSIQTNDGHGDFSGAADIALRGTPSAMAAGDLDRDGKVDLAVASRDDGHVDVYLNQGGGKWGAPVRYSAGNVGSAVAITAADLDGDGTTDLAVGNFEGQSVSVLLGRGDGTFMAGVAYEISGGPIALTTSDLNGDGQPDLIVALATSVDILPNAGHGRFQQAQSFVGGGQTLSIAAADLNGDGMNDLVVGNTSRAVCTLINDSK